MQKFTCAVSLGRTQICLFVLLVPRRALEDEAVADLTTVLLVDDDHHLTLEKTVRTIWKTIGDYLGIKQSGGEG
jgi:hypothetical protein